MFVILKGNDIRNILNGIPAIASVLPGGIKYERELRETTRPYMYIEKMAFPDRGAFNKDMVVTLTIVGMPDSISEELESIFEIIDNEILTDIDGCTPITNWISAEVSHIRQSFVAKPYRDDKQNLILMKDYVFTYIIQN